MIELDASDLDELAREWADTEPKVQREMPRIMKHAGTNMKGDWQMDAVFSRYFRLVPTISFDQTVHFGALHEVEVGPNRHWRAARLAGIAHFGGANGGGGRLGDPQRYADRELPNIEREILALIDRVLA